MSTLAASRKDLPQVLRQPAQPEVATAPAGRWRITPRRLLVVALCILVPVGLFYPVENVVVAAGQVIPSDRVQSVQHLEGGIVTAVHVREGQAVVEGQPLLEIDLGGASLNLEQLTARYATAQAMKTRLLAESQGRPLSEQDFPADLDRQVVQAELGAFAARALEHQGSMAAANATLHQARGEVAETRARIAGLQTSLRLHEQEATISRQLAAEQLIGQLEVIENERALEQVRSQLAAAREALVAAQAKVALAEAKIVETQGAFRSRASDALAEVERELQTLGEDLARARSQRTRTIVLAPTSGIVKGLRSGGAGWVVRPGEPILDIVPDNDQVIVEARLNPSDRGLVSEGQPVKVKITAYDFLRHGSVPGTVTLVAADADRDSDEPGAPSYFRIQASLAQPWVGNTANRITTGMQAEVDLLLGHEPFIWYLLRPVLRVGAEAFREP
ncbi:secretion protein HylD [Lampropedia cohaerens]|uniref:Membrane fusion protein (MFP) family protein n=1 Tax=Lampropedia cohaerens TaxID=1610491 RepID=A0A0U1Q2K2_9BURK|nr:HlyD family type I secretion periplasmic adaptor subunit [Lampropedia cohaerens]KKW68990.1 secretion protein HylD [Lampropedia cohaerens]